MQNIKILCLLALVCVMSCGKKNLTPKEYFAKADTLAIKGAYSEAIAMLGEVEKKYAMDTATVCESYRMIAEVYAGNMSQFPKAIEYYQKIISTYPNRPEASKSLFKIGFTYEDQLKDLTNAKKIYEEFLSKYPNDSLSVSVKFSLDHLGESEEDIIQRLLKQSATK